MNTMHESPGEVDAWENRSVGADERFVEVASDINSSLDAALDLHPISIRLQRSLVENLKALAQINGLGYQPLIRQILTRWVDAELKQIVIQRANELSAQRSGSDSDGDSGEDCNSRNSDGRKAA